MRCVRATLIQSISEFTAYVRPYLEPLLESYASTGVSFEDALLYILAEELELVYMLFDRQHQLKRGWPPHCHIYSQLRGGFPFEFSKLFSGYIAAPQVYADENEVDLVLRGRELYIGYYRDPYQLPQSYHYDPQGLVMSSERGHSYVPFKEQPTATAQPAQAGYVKIIHE